MSAPPQNHNVMQVAEFNTERVEEKSSTGKQEEKTMQ
jgi:hypothetical protein